MTDPKQKQVAVPISFSEKSSTRCEIFDEFDLNYRVVLLDVPNREESAKRSEVEDGVKREEEREQKKKEREGEREREKE